MNTSRSTLLVPFSLLGILVLVCNNAGVVMAGPTGASACFGGMAAVGSTHLSSESVVTGTLADSPALLELVLDEETILSVDEPGSFTIGVDHTLELRRTGKPYFFRGFLFRLGNSSDTTEGTGNGTEVDTTMAFDLDPEAKDTEAVVQVATTYCVDGEGVGGLTHVDNEDKTSVHGILRLDTLANGLPLDVTCVIKNSNGESEYYYSRFILNAVEGEGEESEEGEGTDGDEIDEGDGTTDEGGDTSANGGDNGGGGTEEDESSAKIRFISSTLGLLSICYYFMAF